MMGCRKCNQTIYETVSTCPHCGSAALATLDYDPHQDSLGMNPISYGILLLAVVLFFLPVSLYRWIVSVPTDGPPQSAWTGYEIVHVTDGQYHFAHLMDAVESVVCSISGWSESIVFWLLVFLGVVFFPTKPKSEQKKDSATPSPTPPPSITPTDPADASSPSPSTLAPISASQTPPTTTQSAPTTLPPTPVKHQWFVVRNTQEQGPFTGSQLKSFASAGRLHKDDKIRRGDMTKLVSASSVKGLFPNSSTDVDVVASPPEKNRKRKSIARKIVLIFCGVVCGFVALIVVAAILVPDKSRNGGKSSNVIKSAKPATKPHKALSEFSSSELRDANRLAKLEKAAADQFFFEYSHAKNDAERKATSDGYKNVVNQLFEEERQRGLEDIMDNYRDIYSVRAGPRLP